MSAQEYQTDGNPNRQKSSGLGSLLSCCVRRRVVTSTPAQQALKASASTAIASNSTNIGGASQTSAKALADFNDALCKLEIDESVDARATNIASKVEEYLNHRLQGNFEETNLTDEQLVLAHLAAKFAKEVYVEPKVKRDGYEYTQANSTDGTKAMVCSFSEPNTIVLAVKGSKQVIDWAVNFNDRTDSPSGFLGDRIHGCHSGFLETARNMAELVSASLEKALHSEEINPGQPIDLLFTGHSAGGAVATLLYYHMNRSGTSSSSLVNLKPKFRYIHCITFGAPPITTEPLIPSPEQPIDSGVFIAFINEGDPVTRADGPFVNSLIKLIVSRRPAQLTSTQPPSTSAPVDANMSEFFTRVSGGFIWNVSPPTYHNAGHLLVLKDMDPDGEEDRLGVVKVTREDLGKTIFGDPFKHAMSLYQARIDQLRAKRNGTERRGGGIDNMGTTTNESM